VGTGDRQARAGGSNGAGEARGDSSSSQANSKAGIFIQRNRGSIIFSNRHTREKKILKIGKERKFEKSLKSMTNETEVLNP